MANDSFQRDTQNTECKNNSCASGITHVLGDITNSTFGNITINLNPKFTANASVVENEFDSVVDNVFLH